MTTLVEQARQKVRRAAKDEALVTMAVTDVMRRHCLRHDTAKRAIRVARNRMLKAGRDSELAKLSQQQECERQYAALKGVSSRYPRLFSRIYSEGNNYAIARDFGVTREYVRLLRKKMTVLAESMGWTETALVDDLEG